MDLSHHKYVNEQGYGHKSHGCRTGPAVAVWALVAMAVLAFSDGHQVAHMQGLDHSRAFTRTQHKRYVKSYKAFMHDSKYMDIITVNITALSDSARSWLAAETADIILVQEHRCLSRKEFGIILGFEVIFSPARRTLLSGRGLESSGGGVAILYRRHGLHLVKDRGIKSKGCESTLYSCIALHMYHCCRVDQCMIRNCFGSGCPSRILGLWRCVQNTPYHYCSISLHATP